MTMSALSTRSVLVRTKLMRTAERLYAERGLASVSVRTIGVAAGQRNKSAVQYHFTNRDELIKEILSRHLSAIEQRRMAMVVALDHDHPDGISWEDRTACLIMPAIEHHIELGTPSWYGRFVAQAFVDPALRDFTIQAHLNTPSLRLLNERCRQSCDFDLIVRRSPMVRQCAVHMCAELEYDLAHGRVAPADAETLWRQLGSDVITAVCGRTTPSLL
jgi:AcrR family transcriptional regulator